MIDNLLNITRREVQRMSGLVAQPRMGVVRSYDPVNYCAKVEKQPGGELTGWLPVLTLWGGNGWGLFAPPSPGDVVKILFQEGGKEAGIVLGRFFSTVTRPLAVPAGEFWLVHKEGAALKLTNDGTLTLADKAGSSLAMNADGTVTINANLTVNGTVTATGEGRFNGGHTVSAHRHGGVKAGGDQSATPAG